MRKRLLWTLPGLAVGAAWMFSLRYALHDRFTIVIDQLPFFCAMVSLWVAERQGRAPKMDEVRRPISLFEEQSTRK